ncbi:hypothetical protein THOM_2730 [Trachipleistophora hominis]|uniref:Transposable element encoded protein n=1 Tax=Trachipleistophora hominis TaxID=72359 RepID=L7JUD9_TRAHO|nr:hypothetical protein THOM_2730 [Trachipleistophora hominis]
MKVLSIATIIIKIAFVHCRFSNPGSELSDLRRSGLVHGLQGLTSDQPLSPSMIMAKAAAVNAGMFGVR